MVKYPRKGFSDHTYSNIPNTTNIYVLFILQVFREEAQSFKNLWIWGQILLRGEGMMQSYPPKALDKDSRDAEGPTILMSLRVDFGLMG